MRVILGKNKEVDESWNAREHTNRCRSECLLWLWKMLKMRGIFVALRDGIKCEKFGWTWTGRMKDEGLTWRLKGEIRTGSV